MRRRRTFRPSRFSTGAASLQSSRLGNFVDAAHRQPSSLGGEREGIVLRLEAVFPGSEFAKNVCKSVRRGHVQDDEHWTRNWRPCAIA